MARKLSMRPWQAAMAILAETGNPGVMAGDSGLLSMIAYRCCMEFNGFKSEKRVLDALSREPGLLVARHFRRIDGRDCRGFDLPTNATMPKNEFPVWKQTHHIEWWHPTPGKASGCGFNVRLYSEWKRGIALLGYTQADVDRYIKHTAGDQARALFPSLEGEKPEDIITRINIHWGAWGPEHINVIGNACGLDLEHAEPSSIDGSVCLLPHNVDSLAQAVMLLSLFTWVADCVRYKLEAEAFSRPPSPV